ncbi:hypothetical protein BDF14DRAFT_1742872 [Spinellus fusiger]|nr:hypothetical protein BDF14DRAFT_1742872 [Spinellus fusiger]
MARQRQARQAHTSTQQSHHPLAQQQQQQQQQQQPRQPGLFGQMASTAAGVAVGSTLGHTMANGMSSLWGSSSEPSGPSEHSSSSSSSDAYQGHTSLSQGNTACESDARQFTQCLEQTNNDVKACQWYLENLKACQQMASHY